MLARRGYRRMSSAAGPTHLWVSKTPFTLRSGKQLPELRIAYETWGRLNAKRDNVILLFGGMSASSHAASHPADTSPGWWEKFIGPGRALDTNLFHVICANNLGSCYGTSGPSSINPETGRRFGTDFPLFSIQDMVAAQFALLDHLDVHKLHATVGGSLGGMQAACAAVLHPERVARFVSISATAHSFPTSVAFRHVQRQAIMADPDWNGGHYYDGPLPTQGLRLAREIATLTYRSGPEWGGRFGIDRQHDSPLIAEELIPSLPRTLGNELLIEHYLSHQGKKWVGHFDPNTVLYISKAMDCFTLQAPDEDGRPSLVAGLRRANQPALVIGVQTDVLFPVWQQKELADALRAAGNRSVNYIELDAIYGHDTFLLDETSMAPAVRGHLTLLDERYCVQRDHVLEDAAGEYVAI